MTMFWRRLLPLFHSWHLLSLVHHWPWCYTHNTSKRNDKCEFKCSFLSQKWYYDFAHLKPLKHSFSAATHQYTHLCAKYDKYYNKNLFLQFLYYILFNFKHKILRVMLCQIWYTFYVYQVHGKCPRDVLFIFEIPYHWRTCFYYSLH
jgi:hypothetical protein